MKAINSSIATFYGGMSPQVDPIVDAYIQSLRLRKGRENLRTPVSEADPEEIKQIEVPERGTYREGEIWAISERGIQYSFELLR